MKKTFLFVSILSALSSVASANQLPESEDEFLDFYGDEDFVSIATGTKTSLHKAPAVATVITSEMIFNMGATNIDEVLQTVPGLHITRRSSTNSPIYVFRGIFTRFNPQVLMLINGVPITNIFVGNRGQIWGGMPLEAVSRIEVIRGPGSALYGADAFSGAINVITKSPDEIRKTEVGLRGGSFNTKDAWFIHASDIGNGKASIIYEYHDTDGHKQIIDADAQTRLDKIFGTNASLAPGPMANFRENHDLRLEFDFEQLKVRAGLQEREAGTGAGIVEALSPSTIGTSSRRNIDISYSDKFSEQNASYNLQASYFTATQEYKTDLILYPPGSDIGFGGEFPNGVIGNPEVFERHYKFSGQFSYDEITNHSLQFGAGYNFSEIYKVQERKNFALGPDGKPLPPGSPVVDVSDTPYAFLPERDRESHFAFVQDVWQVANDWEVTAGLRYDNYSDFGSTVNPRLAIVWATSLNMTTKLLHGRAFRAPSFANLYNINNPAALGNPNLNPEKIQTTELVFDYHPSSSFGAVVSFFKYKWQDIIKFVPDANSTTTTAQNTGQNSGYGFEAELNWQPLEKLALRANYSYQNSEDDQNNTQVSMVPKHTAFMEANYKLATNWNFNIHLNYVANRLRAVKDPRGKIDDYSILNTNLVWLDESLPWTVSFSVKNLLNEDAREPTPNNGTAVAIPNDLPLADRQVMLSVRYAF